MRPLSRLTGFAELLLLAVVLVSWGGSSDAIRFDGSGGGGFTGGFFGQEPITVEMTADKTTLPLNITNAGINPSGPYTNTITVVVKQNGDVPLGPSLFYLPPPQTGAGGVLASGHEHLSAGGATGITWQTGRLRSQPDPAEATSGK